VRTLAAVEPAQADAFQTDLRRFAADARYIVSDFHAQHAAHPARAGEPPVIAPFALAANAQGHRGGVAGQRAGQQVAHQFAVGRQLQLQRRLGGLGSQRQFVAFDGQAAVPRAVEIDIELVRRQVRTARAAGEGVQLDFLQGHSGS
jgi:hypothetical protein